MNHSILLTLSGSKQSRYAAELCWDLAKRLGLAITAQHVVNTHSAWKFLGHDNPGFLESIKYVSEYQKLCSSLFALGEQLGVKYLKDSAPHAIENIFVLDEGHPVDQIIARAAEHDLVVMGHQPALMQGQPYGEFLRLSLAESLANQCPKPLLVVQEPVRPWDSMAIMVSSEHINECFINAALAMARSLELQPLILCLAAIQGMDIETFASDLREANPSLFNVPIGLTNMQDALLNQETLWSGPFDQRPSVTANTLIAIPTRASADERLTILDSSPAVFVRYLNLPSVLLWPEECKTSIGSTLRTEASMAGA